MPFCLRFKAFQNGITAAIGAILKTAVRCIQLFLQALKTPFSHILVANEDDGSETNANRNSTFGVRHSKFKNDKNNEYRLTNDECRSFSFVQINENRNSTFRVHHSIFNNKEYHLSSNGTRSIGHSATKPRSFYNSPDCSGYNVELAEHYLSGKRGRSLIETDCAASKKEAGSQMRDSGLFLLAKCSNLKSQYGYLSSRLSQLKKIHNIVFNFININSKNRFVIGQQKNLGSDILHLAS